MYSVSWPAFWPYAAKNEKFGCNQRVYPNNLKYSRKIHTVSCGLIQITDISFPRNREGSCKPLKTLWKSTMGVQSPSTLPTLRLMLIEVTLEDKICLNVKRFIADIWTVGFYFIFNLVKLFHPFISRLKPVISISY